jgi:hypothetical protein
MLRSMESRFKDGPDEKFMRSHLIEREWCGLASPSSQLRQEAQMGDDSSGGWSKKQDLISKKKNQNKKGMRCGSSGRATA